MSGVGNIFVLFTVILKPHCFIPQDCMYKIIISLTKQITSFTSVTSTTESYILPILFSTAIHTQIPQICEYPLPPPGQDVGQKCPGDSHMKGGMLVGNFELIP